MFTEKAILHFLSKGINKQVIVCESRSLRKHIIPGLFLMMMRDPAQGKEKDVDEYLACADKIFHFETDNEEKRNFTRDIVFENGNFVLKK